MGKAATVMAKVENGAKRERKAARKTENRAERKAKRVERVAIKETRMV